MRSGDGLFLEHDDGLAELRLVVAVAEDVGTEPAAVANPSRRPLRMPSGRRDVTLTTTRLPRRDAVELLTDG